MIGENKELWTIRATRPGRLSEGKLEYQHQCDKQEVIDVCLACDRPICRGDCDLRKAGTKRKSKRSMTGVRKNTDPETITSRFDTGMSINRISKELNLSPACVRYWMRKTGRRSGESAS